LKTAGTTLDDVELKKHEDVAIPHSKHECTRFLFQTPIQSEHANRLCVNFEEIATLVPAPTLKLLAARGHSQ
jgi:hypothetical protein